MLTGAAIEGRLLFPLSELLGAGVIPDDISEIDRDTDNFLNSVYFTDSSLQPVENGLLGTVVLVVLQEIVVAPFGNTAGLVIGGGGGATAFEARVRLQRLSGGFRFEIGLYDVGVGLRISPSILRPLKPDSTNEPEPDGVPLDIQLGTVSIVFGTDEPFRVMWSGDVSVPRCMIGQSGVIFSASGIRWLTPSSEIQLSDTPPGFIGLALDNAQIEFPELGIGNVTMDDVFIGSTGFSGKVDWRDDDLTWNPQIGNGGAFEGVLIAELGGFDGGLQRIGVEFKQNALVRCEIEGCIYAPYVKKVIGLDLGLDGNGGFTAIAQAPTCKFESNELAKAGPAKPGYILSADIEGVFKFDVSRIEFHAGGSMPASLSLSGRVKLVIASFDLPAVEFKGLSIDTRGHVAVDGGWLDVTEAKSGPLSGFPLQITRIGFGMEKDGRAWVGLNGTVKLHESLPAGVSVEGLKVSWKDGEPVNFSLEGIGVELAVKGVFSFKGKAAFFQTNEASGFRGSIKLSLDSVGLKIDVGIMVGRMNDGTFFFYLFIDVELPVGIPLFSTGAALYGFAGLLAVNLQPARIDAEHWYYGYYKRAPVGVTAPEKWAVKRGAFAIGVGTTIGSMPDTGYAVSAKVLLILSLPGPRILLQGKGSFIEKKPENKDEKQEGTFEALLVLDTPAQLFQANLSITFKMGALLEVGGGVDAAFSWAKEPPRDVWHVYVGEKEPVERRVHAKVLEFLKGDTWLMINRPHYAESTGGNRLGDFEIGGSLKLGAEFDFTVVKAWLRLSVFAEAAVTWEPQQILANARLNGSAGIAALGMELSAEINAEALAKASKPFYFGASLELEIRVNLIFFKWNFHEKISIEYTRPELPDYVRDFVAIKADHMKASEARDLPGAVVPPDVRPVIIFSKPVRDLAWFGAPGDPRLPVEDLHARQVSYQLRHVVLVANDGTDVSPTYRLVAAAGYTRVSGTSVEFLGVRNDRGPLPDLAGSELRLFNVGDNTGQSFTLSAGGNNSATLIGSAPQGELCYRLSAARATASVTVTGVSDAGFSQVEATLTSALANPPRFLGGTLTSGGIEWTIVNATASSVRLWAPAGATLSPGPATLAGPDPAQLEGTWQAAGDPVEGAGSSTRLKVWGRTPYAMFRYNELETIADLDAFDPEYACGPDAVELPVCTHFEDVPTGPLTTTFTTAGIQGAHNGTVSAQDMAGGPKLLAIVRATITLSFDPPVDAVWISAMRHEFGVIRAFNGGVKIGELFIKTRRDRYRFDGGIDRVEIEAQDASVDEICFTPGWTCVTFKSSFPSNTTGIVSYAGMHFGSEAILRVTAGVLHAVPRKRPLSQATIARTKRLGAFGEGAAADMAVIKVPGLDAPFIAVTPILGDVRFEPGAQLSLPTVVRMSRRDKPAVHVIAQIESQPKRIAIQDGLIWNFNTFVPMVTLTIEFERPVTRARILLGQQAASAVALAGTLQASAASGAARSAIALYADPQGIGWFNRLVITAPGEIEVVEICTDRGDFGWQRYQQWTWRQGVKRSIESLYSEEPVLSPGRYELRVHTTAEVTGEQPTVDHLEVAVAKFEVGKPPGFAPPLVNPMPAGADPQKWNYPDGGPLTQLATYVDRTMPAHGARLWYRNLDTAVGFNENYVTRMYQEAEEELRVFVLNSSDVALRDGTRHVWGSGSAALDATTLLYVRTLAGDGTDTCASVDVSRITLPEAVVAGTGELLDASTLHRSQLRTRRTNTVVHEFEFTTSQFASFLHLTTTFDGHCPRLAPRTQNITWDPRDHADAQVDAMTQLETARTQALATIAAGRDSNATRAQIEAAATAPAALAANRAGKTEAAAAAFADAWSKTFETIPRPTPSGLRLSVVNTGNPTATDVILLESPEPIAWDRVNANIRQGSAVPLDRRTITIGSDFGRPDLGFEVEYGGLLWRAGVELWFNEGALRSRANVPLDIELVFPHSSSAEIVVRANDVADMLADCNPPMTQVTRTALPEPGTFQLLVRAPAQTTLRTLRVQGLGIGIVSCTVHTPFRPQMATGPLRIVAVTLPTSTSDLMHEVILMATEPVSLQGWSVRWIDPATGGQSKLYAECTVDLLLTEARLVRFVPSVASTPAVDDVLVLAGGPGVAPPPAGAIFQLLDPDGVCRHECAAMATDGPMRTLMIVPDADGSRAFLIPPRNETEIGPGFWQLTLTFAGELNAPDMDTWTVGGRVLQEAVQMPFLIE